MTIISSQQYLNWDIVDQKLALLKDASSVTIPCYYVGYIDGIEYAMVADGHHRIAAARELGIEITYDIDDDPEHLTGEELLNTRWMGDDYYLVDESDVANNHIILAF